MSDQTPTSAPHPYWNPYVAGVGLGLTLLLSFVVLGAGLGASGSIARVAASAAHTVAPAAVERNAYMGSWFADGSPLANYLVFMSLGALVGGFASAWSARRIKPSIERGPRTSAGARIALAVAGGALVGFGSRLAGGCTSGQALTGGSLLLTGGWTTMMAIFGGAYATAWFVRKEWL